MKEEQSREHRWLERLVGEWTVDGDCDMGPGEPPSKYEGVERVRSLGGLWTIGEGESPAPEGSVPSRTIMTLGYDPKLGRFVGTFIASIMTHLWLYEGSLDDEGRVLTLNAEGPSMTAAGTAKYRDTIEFVNDDHRVLRSVIQGDDGEWTVFMTADYRRKK